MLMTTTSITDSYLTTKHQLNAPELIEFASYKEGRGDYIMAANYLSLALKSVSKYEQKKALEDKIRELTKRKRD